MLTKKIQLTTEQINFYKTNGYLLVQNFIKQKDAQKIKSYAVKNIAEKPDYPINLNVHRKEKLFGNIISNNNLVGIVKDLQKKPVVGLNDQMIYKKRNTV